MFYYIAQSIRASSAVRQESSLTAVMLLKNQCKVLRQSSNVLSQGVTLLFFPKHDLLRISSSFLSWRSSEASGKQHRWTIEITYTHLSTRPHISNFAWISYAENFRKAHLPFSCPSIIVILVSTSEVLLGIVHPSARLTSRSYSSSGSKHPLSTLYPCPSASLSDGFSKRRKQAG